ncbi:MAG TPA: type II toxin-antitoxin system VapC family toxin, partial [Acidimicrobiia bacterium]|nr:type II toxin-antitoxin system VapC family toxin [Acidimicrobiia bacterium]
MVTAYFDTSAIVALVLEERASPRAIAEWDLAASCASVTLLYVEGRAALARAVRRRDLDGAAERSDHDAFESFCQQVAPIGVTPPLVRRAGEIAADYLLRAYDAVHLAAAETLTEDAVFVSGDNRQCSVAQMLGLGVVRLYPDQDP